MSVCAPIRILSVDDHAMFREGITAIITSQFDMRLVAEASTGCLNRVKFQNHSSQLKAEISAKADARTTNPSVKQPCFQADAFGSWLAVPTSVPPFFRLEKRPASVMRRSQRKQTLRKSVHELAARSL
jgi:hypothetical protein